jgi:hypothetical protein
MDGKPVPTVKWRKDGSFLDVDADERIDSSITGGVAYATATLQISQLKNTDDGSYSCSTSNIVTTNVISSSAQLVVNCKTMIYT